MSGETSSESRGIFQLPSGSFHEVESIQKLCVLPGHYMQPIKKQMWPCVFVSMNLKIEYYPTV